MDKPLRGRPVSLQSRESLDALTTCSDCGERIGLCECDQDFTDTYDQFIDSCNIMDFTDGTFIGRVAW